MWRRRPQADPAEGHLLRNVPPALTKISHIYHSQVQVHFKANFVSSIRICYKRHTLSGFAFVFCVYLLLLLWYSYFF